MRRQIWLIALIGVIGIGMWLGLGRRDGAAPDEGTPVPAVAMPAVTVMPSRAAQPEQAGEATFYEAGAAGACSFEPGPPPRLVAAVGPELFAGSAACGAYLEVRGPRGSALVQVADLCGGCAPGHIDLSRDAFAQIADPAQGRVAVRWRAASPELAGPLVYHFKPGSSEWWAAVQLRNHRNPVAELAYRRPDGSWAPLARGADNYFVSDGAMGPGPYALRVTDSHGNVIVDEAVPLAPGGAVPGGSQLPPAP